MYPPYITPEGLRDLITAALQEDIGRGDISTLASIPEATQAKAHLLVKDPGVFAGSCVAEKIFLQFDPRLTIEHRKKDGDDIIPGDIVMCVQGSARSILSAERTVLNVVQRMSGIATHTRRLCRLLQGTRAQLLDTRKTTPNFRMMEKWAVQIGGGVNHRYALYSMVMLKNNHIDLAGGITEALRRTQAYLKNLPYEVEIEVETRNLREVEEVLRVGGVQVIMLDNMTVEDMTSAVRLIKGRTKTEASGGITEENLRSVADSGVDYISVGALTHSVKSLDLSLKVMPLQ